MTQQTDIFEVLKLGQQLGQVETKCRTLFWILGVMLTVLVGIIPPATFFFFDHMVDTKQSIGEIRGQLAGSALEKLPKVTTPNVQ